jgi:hypothetical protein
VYARNNPVSGTDPSGLIVQFSRTQGTSRREADAKALADWLGYDLHVTGAGIITITGKRSSNLDGGSLPAEFEAMVNSKTVYSAEDIFQRVLMYNSNGRSLFDRATDYYAQLRPDMLDTWEAGFNKGAAAGAEGFKEGFTLGAYQAPDWAREYEGFGFSRLMGNTALAAVTAPLAVAATPATITTAGVTTTAATVTTAASTPAGQRAIRSIETTLHGAERIAGPAATRGGVLTEPAIALVRQVGIVMQQGDGAIVRILPRGARFDVVIENQTTNRVITTFEGISRRALGRLARRYGWQ